MGLRPVAILVMASFLSGCASTATAAPATTASPGRAVTSVTRSSATPTPAGTPGALTAVVELGDHWYSPAQLTVVVGTTVTWKMVGTQEHDVWALDGSFHSPTLTMGMSYAHTFTKPGVYDYFCVPHYGDGMKGSVTVIERR